MLKPVFAVLVSALSLAASAQHFPVTIEHKFGSTTLEEKPTHVVSLGYTEQDALFALGIKPVTVRYFFGDETSAMFPWTEKGA